MKVEINPQVTGYLKELAHKFNVSFEEAVNSVLIAHWLLELTKDLDKQVPAKPVKMKKPRVVVKNPKELKEKARMKRDNDALNYYSLHAPVVKKNPEEGC